MRIGGECVECAGVVVASRRRVGVCRKQSVHDDQQGRQSYVPCDDQCHVTGDDSGSGGRFDDDDDHDDSPGGFRDGGHVVVHFDDSADDSEEDSAGRPRCTSAGAAQQAGHPAEENGTHRSDAEYNAGRNIFDMSTGGDRRSRSSDQLRSETDPESGIAGREIWHNDLQR